MSAPPLEMLEHMCPVLGIMNLAQARETAGIERRMSDLQLAVPLVSLQIRAQLQKLVDDRESRYTADPFAPALKSGSNTAAQTQTPRKTSCRYRCITSLPPAKDRAAVQVHASRLSPFNPDSPLYPDGLITVDWVLKHRDHYPAMVIAFYDIADGTQPAQTIIQLDTQLVEQIKAQKKLAVDLGIRFVCIVIMQHSSIDFQLDARLSGIKKSSNQESKGAFYTVTPRTDLAELLTTLETSNYDHLLNFYREHIKRVKRKKSKATGSTRASFSQPSASIGAVGASVRYDFKLGCFSEIVQDTEWSIRYYITAYNSLMDIFKEIVLKKSKASLSSLYSVKPHSKRWQEMVTIADSLNFKIARILVFGDSPGDGLFQLNRHINFFRGLYVDLKEEPPRSSQRFWSWLSLQHRFFADLVEMALRHGVNLPRPGISAAPSAEINYLRSEIALSTIFGVDNDAGLAVTPSNCVVELHHPGYYYHMAAVCLQRQLVCAGANVQDDLIAPIIELLTKAYEQYKRYKGTRMALYLAGEIAAGHVRKGNFDIAQKFYARIARTYHKEHWDSLLGNMLEASVECARKRGDWRSVLELSLELLSPSICPAEDVRTRHLDQITAIMADSTVEFPHMQMSLKQALPFVRVHMRFRKRRVYVGQPAYFQLTVEGISTQRRLHFSGIRLHFSNPEHDILLQALGQNDDAESGRQNGKFHFVDCTTTESAAGQNLLCARVDTGVGRGQTVVFFGKLTSTHPHQVQVESCTFILAGSKWKCDLVHNFSTEVDQFSGAGRGWISRGADGSGIVRQISPRLNDTVRHSVRFNHRQPQFRVELQHMQPALLGEYYCLRIHTINGEAQDMKAYMNISCTAEDTASDDVSTDRFFVGATSLNGVPTIEDMDIGIIARHSQTTKDVFLQCLGPLCARKINVSVYFRLTTEQSSVDLFAYQHAAQGNYSAIQHSVLVPVVNPLAASFDWKMVSRSAEDNKNNNNKRILHVCLRNQSSMDLVIAGGDLEPNDSEKMETQSVISGASTGKAICRAGSTFNFSFQFTDDVVSSDYRLKVLWTRSNKFLTFNHDRLSEWSQPVSNASAAVDAAVTVSVETEAYLHLNMPTTVVYSLSNITHKVCQLVATVDITDQFVFSGYKSFSLRLLPGQTRTFKFKCWPLVAGAVMLPHFHVYMLTRTVGADGGVASEQQELAVTAAGPVRVFVGPQQSTT